MRRAKRAGMTEPEESDSDADAVEMGLRRQDFFALVEPCRQYRNAQGEPALHAAGHHHHKPVEGIRCAV